MITIFSPRVALIVAILEAWSEQPAVCTSRAGGPGFATRDSAGVAIVENQPPATAPMAVHVDAAPLIELGGAASLFTFTRIAGATRLQSGAIVVGDRSPVEVRAFDASGRFLGRIGRAGQGPGEYERISSIIRLPNDTILIVDSPHRKFLYFTSGGQTIRSATYAFVMPARSRSANLSIPPSTPAPVELLGRFADGSFLASTTPAQFSTGVRRDADLTWREVIVLHLDASLQRVDTLMRYASSPFFSRPRPGVSDGTRIGVDLPFVAVGSVAAATDGFYGSTGDKYEIVRRDVRGRVTQILRACRPVRPFTNADIAEWRTQYVATALPRARSIFEETAQLIPYPKTLPAYSQLIVDAAGRLWAREYGKEHATQRWNVFNPRGQYLGDAVTPADNTVLEIGSDYVLAIATGSDMVQSIKLYRTRNIVGTQSGS